MTQRQHFANPRAAVLARAAVLCALAAATLAFGACKRTGPEPPGGELRSALAAPTLAGGQFDPGTLGDKITMVMFWSPG